MKFRPCIDLHGGQVKQIVGMTLTENPADLVENFVSTEDSSYYARLFQKDNLPGGHVIMLGAGNEEQAKNALSAWPGGMQVGGGITPVNAGEYLSAGASHVIVTSYVFKDGQILWDRIRELKAAVGQNKIVLDLSCRRRGDDYYVVTDRWQKWTDVRVTPETLGELGDSCAEYLVHAADVEGKASGIDEELIARLSRFSPVPVTYAGGIRSLSDIELVRQAGADRVDFTVGSALDIFGGKLAYRDIVGISA